MGRAYARDDADAICLQPREPGQEDQIRRVTLAFPEREQHEADGAEERNPHHPLITLDPILVRLAEEAHGAQGGREEELDGEDGVDFADELHADG